MHYSFRRHGAVGRNAMMTHLFLAAAVAASAPAADRAPADAPSAAPTTRPQRYCITDTITGSRVPRKVCQTREQWRDQGVELPARY
jgi:predicted secreted protein